jgi:1-acyl-sn-glycerol-3-phosphate acyltransferase
MSPPSSSSSNPAPRSRFLRFRQAQGAEPWGSRPDDLDPRRLEATLRRLGPLFHPESGPYPARVAGWENLPEPGALVISNHSGGTVIPDVWGLMSAWYRHNGVDRPLHGLAHEMVFSLDRTARFFAQRGILRATRTMARTILGEYRRDLLVLPGGDLDTWRPFSERWTVDFHGRKGYARMALETGAPVVPVAHAGAHHTLIVLDDGRKVAEFLRFPELFRAHIFPVHLSLPYGLGIGPLPHLPPPTALRYRIGRAIVPEPLAPGQAPTADQIAALDLQVRAEMQHELNILRDESEAMLDRLDAVVQRARGAVVRLKDRDLRPEELKRFARSVAGKGRQVVGVAAR